MILLSLSISNILATISPIPVNLYFYTFNNHEEFVPHIWCWLDLGLNVYFPTVFHNISVWLLLWLAIQRYFHVCKIRSKFSIWCKRGNSRKIIFAIYITFPIINLWKILITDCKAIEILTVDPTLMKDLNSTLLNENYTFSLHSENQFFSQKGSILRPADWYYKYSKLINILNSLFKIILIHFVPSLLLIYLNSLLIREIRQAGQRRKRISGKENSIIRTNNCHEERKLSDSNRTTLMLVLVVGLTLIIEIPEGIVHLINLIMDYFEIDFIPVIYQILIASILNTGLLVSYNLNFIIICGMSRSFRQTFKSIFCQLSFARPSRRPTIALSERHENRFPTNKAAYELQENANQIGISREIDVLLLPQRPSSISSDDHRQSSLIESNSNIILETQI